MQTFIIPLVLGATTVLFVLGYVVTGFIRIMRDGESLIEVRS